MWEGKGGGGRERERDRGGRLHYTFFWVEHLISSISSSFSSNSFACFCLICSWPISSFSLDCNTQTGGPLYSVRTNRLCSISRPHTNMIVNYLSIKDHRSRSKSHASFNNFTQKCIYYLLSFCFLAMNNTFHNTKTGELLHLPLSYCARWRSVTLFTKARHCSLRHDTVHWGVTMFSKAWPIPPVPIVGWCPPGHLALLPGRPASAEGRASVSWDERPTRKRKMNYPRIKSNLFIHRTSQTDSGVFTIKTMNVKR